MTDLEQMTRAELIDELMRRSDFAGVIIWRTDEPPFGPGACPVCVRSQGCDPVAAADLAASLLREGR